MSAVPILEALNALPAPVRAAVISATSKVLGKAAGGVFASLRSRFLPTPEQKARKDALRAAVNAALLGNRELDPLSIATILTREPFTGIVLGVLEHPLNEIDAELVRGAFQETVYDLPSIGIDELAFVRDLQKRFLEALRLGTSETARQLHAGARLEHLAAGQARTEAAVSSLVAAQATVEPEDQEFATRMGEAKAQYEAGAVTAALHIWERLRDAFANSRASAGLRARVFNNIGAVAMELGRTAEAIEPFRRATEHMPDSSTYLGHLAQAELMAGRVEAARLHAERALALDETNLPAWSVLIQASTTPIPLEAIPESLRRDFQITIARSYAAGRNDSLESLRLLREAHRDGDRNPQLLILLAEKLYAALFPRHPSAHVASETLDEIDALAAEAARSLQGTERTSLLVRWHRAGKGDREAGQRARAAGEPGRTLVGRAAGLRRDRQVLRLRRQAEGW